MWGPGTGGGYSETGESGPNACARNLLSVVCENQLSVLRVSGFQNVFVKLSFKLF